MQELEEYIEAHQDSFYRVAFTYVKDRDAALDVVQNAVVQALTHIHTLREPAYMRTWFYRILVNEGLGYLRKNKHCLPVEEESMSDLISKGYLKDTQRRCPNGDTIEISNGQAAVR